MSPETRRAALSATARIAFATALAGCHTPSPAGGTSHATDVGTATAAAPVKVPAACDTTARGGPALAAATSCCTALVGAAVADGGAGLKGEAQRECCSFLATQNDAAILDAGSDQMRMPFRHECCSALGWKGTITCTPWGPPVPPEYDA